MNSLEKMVVAKQIKNITHDDMIKDFKMLKEYIHYGKRSRTGTIAKLLHIYPSTRQLGIRRLHSGFL
jgi:Mn-dependent DtxR family transcriptional regulator